jgi:UDPglucose 6-dehydrogenase
MKIAVVGTGYVGLVTGTCFAETGNEVTCIDIDQKKIEKLNKGEIPIFEPGLNLLFDRNVKQGRLHFTTSLSDGIVGSEIIFLALPTPPGEDGSADLKYILGVADELSKIITDYKVIVDKSTVPVGTSEKVEAALTNNLNEELFDVVSNPEFLREGVAVDDFMKPDRVVIGTSSDKAKEVMLKLYKPFVRQGNPIIVMDERSAEMTKYAANSFLATKITFMNEVANLCDKVGANVDMVRKGIGSDTRIGKRFLFPGIGYGGSCFPKDVQALDKTADENGYNFSILKSVMKVNDKQKLVLADKILEYYGDVKGKKIAIWGLAFKPNTDDIREAPSLYIINKLLENGATIEAFDPEAMENVKEVLGSKVSYGKSQYDILENADCLVICTEWSVFRTPNFEKIKMTLKQPVIFDGRNLYESEEVNALGFEYYSIGRPNRND